MADKWNNPQERRMKKNGKKMQWGFVKTPCSRSQSSANIGFLEHDMEVSKMQGRARGHKVECKTYCAHFYVYTYMYTALHL